MFDFYAFSHSIWLIFEQLLLRDSHYSRLILFDCRLFMRFGVPFYRGADIIRSCWFVGSLWLSRVFAHCLPPRSILTFLSFNRIFFALEYTCKYSIVIGAVDKNCLCKQCNIIGSNKGTPAQGIWFKRQLTVGENASRHFLPDAYHSKPRISRLKLMVAEEREKCTSQSHTKSIVSFVTHFTIKIYFLIIIKTVRYTLLFVDIFNRVNFALNVNSLFTKINKLRIYRTLK